MLFHKPNPVDSFENLRERVKRFLKSSRKPARRNQLSFRFPMENDLDRYTISAKGRVVDFLDFITDAVPDGDVYLFGGVLRDLALLGKRGFRSDIDLVVEGNWDHCISYLESLGARRNKFGGFRLQVSGWPIDIWNARETWAIKQGHVQYTGIAALTKTTILNWDAILMNWRTGHFIYREGYLSALRERILDVVLEENPNPLGMAVRVFRHLGIKDARKITTTAAEYLANCTSRYSYEEIRDSEVFSYGNSTIDELTYKFFKELERNNRADMQMRFKAAIEKLGKEEIAIFNRQRTWDFDNLIDDSLRTSLEPRAL